MKDRPIANAEEETFNRLRRRPFDETWTAYLEWGSRVLRSSSYTIEAREQFLEQYGWTWADFYHARQEWYARNSY